VDVNVEQLARRRLTGWPVVIVLHDLSPVGRRTMGGRVGRKLERFAEVLGSSGSGLAR
jgi:hypothetical protein